MFELILRMRGNYLWPAMWGKASTRTIPRNPALADEMGVVIGTSHHEPMMRAHVDWERHGEGPWDYDSNADGCALLARGHRADARPRELVTIGMRGDGDEPMTEGTATALLERIVARPAHDHRGGDRPARRGDAAGLGALQGGAGLLRRRHAGAGRRHPALRRRQLGQYPPPARARRRRGAGGYGVYYHFDYVGGPRNYKWLNTNQIERVWEQMHLAYEHGADRLWIVNVGDIKPMEFPIPSSSTTRGTPRHGRSSACRISARWAARQFGEGHAAAIGEL